MQNNNLDLLTVLTREGVLISVSVRYWRGCKKLRAEDLGLDPDNVSDRLISLGHKRLLPKQATSALSLVEGRTHAFIESNTFPFLNGLAHYVPNSKLAEVTGKLKELESDFWEAKKDFVNCYRQLREGATTEWRQMAAKLLTDPEHLLATIESSFPVSGAMDRYFGFDVHLFQIAVPERLGIDMVSLEDQHQVMQSRQLAAQEAADRIRRQTESFVADCVGALREQTALLCEEMLRSIQTSEVGVHQKTLNRLIRFIEQFKQMNFANDTVMEEQLEGVRRELLTRTAEEYRDNTTARQRLTTGLSRLADHARELAKGDATAIVQRFGDIGRRKFHLAA